jgi:L-malate glycosyltransferase
MSTTVDPSKPITLVHIASGDLWAGAEVQLYQLARELQKYSRIRLLVVLLNHGILEEKLIHAGISTTVFDEKTLSSTQIFSRICSFLRTFSPDIVHTHRQKENVLGSFAAFLCSTAKSLRTVHGAPELYPGRKQIDKQFFVFMDWLAGRMLQDKIIAVSAQLADQLTARFSEKAIRTIENGIDLDDLRTAAGECVSLPGPADAVKVAIVGRLVPVKRVDVFLRIARLMSEHDKRRYAFYVFGDGPLAGDIANLANNLGLDQQVFMMGFRRNIAAYLSMMNILMSTSDHEGLPINLLEALSLRVPVIAHAVGGIPTVLDNGRCGILVAGQDPKSYAEAIEVCLTDTDATAVRIENGYQQVANRYSIKNTADKYNQIYLELLRAEK